MPKIQTIRFGKVYCCRYKTDITFHVNCQLCEKNYRFRTDIVEGRSNPINKEIIDKPFHSLSKIRFMKRGYEAKFVLSFLFVTWYEEPILKLWHCCNFCNCNCFSYYSDKSIFICNQNLFRMENITRYCYWTITQFITH